ncbi:MAG: outer membrane beta-barrel protein [Ignavibacteriaceae bacterium]|nr:outer membrane beta-barrel protein [Ignavibacteriaceae bacterium]
MLKKVVIAFGFTMLMLMQVNAQSINIGPLIGFQKAADADEGQFSGGAAMRLMLTQSIGFEASINYRTEKYLNGALTVKSWPIMITGLFYPIPIVYGAIGTGWYNTTFDYDQTRFPFQFVADETKQKIGWHFGGGLELPIGTNSILTADIRYVFIDYDFNSIPGLGDKNSDFYVFSVGLLFGL